MPARLPQKKIDQCDDCDVKLITRKDDQVENIQKRQEIYMDETRPIIDYYRGQTETEVIDFEPKRGKDDYPLVRELLRDHLNTSNVWY